MSFRIRVTPSGHEFTVERGESILDAALRAGLALNYGCTNGTCGECKARVISGQVDEIRFHDYLIAEAERQLAYTLLCCATALDDLVIEASEADGPEEIAVQEITARVHSLDRIREDVVLLNLRTPRSQVLRFLSGQYVTLTLDGLPPSNRSIASCPCDGRNLQFHVRNVLGDPFAKRLFDGVRKLDKVIIEGPKGHFNLDEDSTRPIILFAYDTGFGPIKSLIEHAINVELMQAMHLYWYVPRRGAHYMDNYCRAWVDALDAFAYTPLAGDGQLPMGEGTLDVSAAKDEHVWTAATAGEKVIEDHPDLTGFDVYMVGPEHFSLPAKDLFLEYGLPEERLFIDAPIRP